MASLSTLTPIWRPFANTAACVRRLATTLSVTQSSSRLLVHFVTSSFDSQCLKGQSKSGVYVCRYVDVALKHSEYRTRGDSMLAKMLIFKVLYGTQTLALVRKDAQLPPINATPNFNSHMSVIAPRLTDDVEAQFDHSQVDRQLCLIIDLVRVTHREYFINN